MGNNKDNIVTYDTFDFYLGICGFTYPSTEAQLDMFDRLYMDFDYQLKDVRIDCEAIIKNTFIVNKVITLSKEENTESILELKMAARKGIHNLPKDIIDKMYGKHRKGPDDKK